MGRIAVATCPEYRCVESGKIKGQLLAEAIGEGVEYHVHVPVTKSGLVACLTGADYAVLSFHGAANGIQDIYEDGSYKTVALIDDIKKFPTFQSLRLVILLICSAAGGENDNNIAAEISRHIAKDGLVIANRYVITGTSKYARSSNNQPGWVAYQNGKVVIPESKFPVRVTMSTMYSTAVSYWKGQL